METKRAVNGVMYVCFNSEFNGKWIIENSDMNKNWTYLIFQKDEFTRIIVGYIVKQKNGKYKVFDLMQNYEKYYESIDDAIHFAKDFYINRREC